MAVAQLFLLFFGGTKVFLLFGLRSDSERKLQALRDRSAQEVQRAIDTETEKLRAIQQCRFGLVYKWK